MYVFITLIIVLLKEKACHFYMFMLFFGLEKKALLLVFVLLLARTAHFETFNSVRENRIHSSYCPGTAQLKLSHSHLIWRLSSAVLT